MITMAGHMINSIFLHEDDTHSTWITVLLWMIRIFLMIHMTFTADRAVHLFLRLFLSRRVHIEFSDVFPSSSCEIDYPLVAVQLPMINEIECCESAIECACNLDWPKSRLVIQVLDDSTDQQTKLVINNCVQKWYEQGLQINVYRRPNRQGFKAGSLNYGMSFISQAEYVAIFDVDFLPAKDFLCKAIPPLMQDRTIAFVQGRWTFFNAKETFLTRMQEIALNFHHKCEQEGRFRASLFFNFNGTGGVWRTSAIEDIGGWHTDTLVEDLDLSLRAYLKGWRSVYMHDVECLNEIPPTLSAYFSQQHRWTSGPMQVARKLASTVFQSKHISWYKKLYCVWYLFRCFAYLVTFISLMLVMPINIWILAIESHDYINMFCSIVTSFSYVPFTFDETHSVISHALFLNAMSLNHVCALTAGLFDYGKAKQWIVTPKFGSGNNKIPSSSTSIEMDTSELKQNTQTFNELTETNINSPYSPWSCSFLLVISHHFRSVYYRASQKFRVLRLNKKNFLMAVYLLLVSFTAFRKRIYLSAAYLCATSIMCFMLAFSWIGR